MEYRFSKLFEWSSGKPVILNDGNIPVYGSNGIVGYSDTAKYKNKIILGRVGAYCGSVEYCPTEFNATDNTLVTTCNTDLITYKYAYYLLKEYKLNSYAGGSAQPLITQSILKHLKCNLPSIDIQLNISNILSTYDDLIENNNKRIELLENMAQELYKEWFVRFRFPGHKTAKFINGIPEGWMVDKIKNRVNRLSFNRLYKEYELNNEGNVIVIDQSEKDYLGFHNNEPSHIANYEAPICLFGDHSCKFKLMTIPFSLGENVVPFKGLDIDTYYLYFSVHKIIKTEEYKRHWGVFTSKKILIPTEDLQNNFAQIVQPIQQQIDIIYKSQILLKRQRDLLLPRLMSGKLEVKVS